MRTGMYQTHSLPFTQTGYISGALCAFIRAAFSSRPGGCCFESKITIYITQSSPKAPQRYPFFLFVLKRSIDVILAFELGSRVAEYAPGT